MDRDKPLKLIKLSETKCEPKPKLTLDCLGEIPVQCPLETCFATICRQDLLYHLTSRHLRSNGKQHLQLVYAGERCTLTFDHLQLTAKQTICLGVLLYGGERGKEGQLPGVREFSHPNRLPPNSKLESLQDYLPVMVLVRKTSFLDWVLPGRNVELDEDRRSRCQESSSSESDCSKRRLDWVRHLDFACDKYPKLSGEQRSDNRCNNRARNSSEELVDLKKRDITEHERKDVKNLDMYTIWTQSAPCIRPLHVCMTVFNRNLTDGRSALGVVANSGRAYPEIRGKELPKDRHSMWLTQQEVQEICGTEYHLHLEVILNEPLE